MGAPKPYSVGSFPLFCALGVCWGYLLGSTLPLHLWRREKHFEACREMEEQWKHEFEREYQARLENRCRREVRRALGLSCPDEPVQESRGIFASVRKLFSGGSNEHNI